MNNRFESFVGTIYVLNKEIQRIKALKMKQFGLRATDTMTMYYLGQHPEGLPEAELARLVRVDRAAITRTVAKLREQGFVRLANWDGGTRYRVPVVLTERGQAATKEMDQIIYDVVEQASADISEGEREAMYATLAQIAQKLEEIGK